MTCKPGWTRTTHPDDSAEADSKPAGGQLSLPLQPNGVSVYYPPDETEFSRAEINRFTATFVGYLEGHCESLATRWTERCLLAVESNLILFGSDREKFFTREFQDRHAAVNVLLALSR